MAGGERERLRRLRANFEKRAQIYDLTRAFFRDAGFLEIETPVRVPAVAPEEHIVPVRSGDWFLSTSPELYMKRLLAAGSDRLFQLSRCFREGERGRWHNPEFTLLEWYRAGTGYLEMLADTERLVSELAGKSGLGTELNYQSQRIDLAPPWHRTTVRRAFMEAAGWDPVAEPDPRRFDIDLVDKVIPAFPPERPTILLDYPAPMASLARLKPGAKGVAERAEIFIGGLELANAYSELTDRAEQERRFRVEAAAIKRERGYQPPVPEKFLEAIDYLPACGGIALGMDRLVMLLCDAASIDEVLPFTVDTA